MISSMPVPLRGFFGLLLFLFIACGCKSLDHTHSSSTTDSRTFSGSGANQFEGRYLGYVRLSHLLKAPIILDVVGVDDPSETHTRAVLKLLRGDFMSTEYVSVYFPQVRLDAASGKVDFGDNSAGVSTAEIQLAGEFIDGTVSLSEGTGGYPFKLRKQVSLEAGALEATALFPEVPAMSSITGNYFATCEGHALTLQIEATKWPEGSHLPLSAFPGYHYSGRMGSRDPVTCVSTDLSCIQGVYQSGSADLLATEVKLRGQPMDKTCTLQGQRLVCDGCEFAKQDFFSSRDLNPPMDYSLNPHTMPPLLTDAPDLKPNMQAEDVAGQYFGFLHHEGLNRYQTVGLNIEAKTASVLSIESQSSPSLVDVRAVGALYFGEASSNEFVAHRFDAAQISAVKTRVILDGSGESFFKITDWRKGSVRGIWYSKSAGRVGTVELVRGSAPALAAKFEGVPKISGRYISENWEFELSASASVSESADDFFPVKVFGWARERLQTPRRRMIQDGSYDYFTGVVALTLDDGRTVSGRVTKSGLELFWPPWTKLGATMDRQETINFIPVPPASPAAAQIVR